MNRATAHFVLGILDVAALYACYYVFDEWAYIGEQIENRVEQISIQAYFGLYALMALIPLIHALSFFSWKDGARKWLSRSLIALLILLFINAFVLESRIKARLSDAGYHYCQALSEQMTFSEFSTYLSDHIPCQK
ncbi:MAG: hypothetical protein P8163_17265 [Candidatus Thiodiazotropha sp.]